MDANAFAQTHQLIQHDGIVQDINFIKIKNLVFYSNPESQDKTISIHVAALVRVEVL
jgi:hypothetical protein